MIYNLRTQFTYFCLLKIVKTPFTKASLKLQYWRFFCLLTSLLFILLTGSTAAQCLTSGLNEEEQLAVTKGLFSDGLYPASSESSKCFLQEFKESSSREEVFFLRAEALRKGGDLQGAIKAYDELHKNFPTSKTYIDNAMLQKGISMVLNREYTASIKTLRLLLHDFPTTKYRNEALYWLGFASSFWAESLRGKNNKESLFFYKASTRHFVAVDPDLLNHKQQQERLHLIGRSWLFLKDLNKTEEAWSQYLRNAKSIEPEKALNLKYQLATRFQKEKNYKKAEKWFALIITMHPDSKLAIESTFLRAEMAYAVSLRESKNKELNPKVASLLVNHYRLYLKKNDNEYQALANYRIGVLYQSYRSNEAINAFQKYLETKDTTYTTEVFYRLGYLFIKTKQQNKAIKTFEKYLRINDNTYKAEVLYQLAFLYIEIKKQKKAIKNFEKYINTNEITNRYDLLNRLA